MMPILILLSNTGTMNMVEVPYLYLVIRLLCRNRRYAEPGLILIVIYIDLLVVKLFSVITASLQRCPTAGTV